MMASHDNKRATRLFQILDSKKTKLCAVLLTVAMCASFLALFPSQEEAHAAGAVLWGHKGKNGITKISDAEIARFSDGSAETAPAEYSDSVWGEYVLGGVNRVSESYLPVKRSDLVEGANVVDSYEKYITQNVSVVRHGGGEDSNLSISVNGENKGYIKMDVNSGDTGRYLYYSIATTSLTGAKGEYYGTFAVDIGSSSGLVVRTEANKNGGAAFVTESYETYNDSANWINGFEYGCIDLKALVKTENVSESIKSVYLFGTSKTKVMLNYLIISDTAPTKIDVANGNIVFANGVEGDDSPVGLVRTYPDVSGKNGTATLNMNGTDRYYFENLVVDTNYTPYLYYSFSVNGSNNATLSFYAENSSYYVAKKGNDNKITSVTGCIKLETLLGMAESGIVNIATDSKISKSFTFSAGASIKVNYLFFASGLDVALGEHVIVKNADAINIYNADGTTYRDYKLTDFSEGSLPASYTYKYKANSGTTTGVWAPYKAEIKSRIIFDYGWYVNTTNSMLNAVRIGESNMKSGTGAVSLGTRTVNAEFSYTETLVGADVEMKVLNPTKKHNGLYIFCLIVAKNDEGTYNFAETLSQSDIDLLDDYWSVSTGFCRLDVADNLVYHSVDQEGTEKGIIGEDWLVYGSDSKVISPFEKNGEYVKYDKYDPGSDNEYGIETKNPETNRTEYVSACIDGYTVRDYNYDQIDESVAGVNYDGWILFDETVKNPNGERSHGGYVNIYKNNFKNTSVVYNDEATHKHWTIPKDYSVTLQKDAASLFMDTTLNLYVKWEIPVDAEDLKVDVFVDDFGTTFIAKETEDGKIVSAPKDETGKNEFIRDVVYVSVAPKSDGTTATIAGGNGEMQYSADGGLTWVAINDASSLIKDIYAEETDMSVAKAWYTEYTEYSYDVVYAVTMDTDDILEAFGKTDGNMGPAEKFEIKFRYIAGVADENGWFNFTGKAVCGSLKFIPFKYNDLT